MLVWLLAGALAAANPPDIPRFDAGALDRAALVQMADRGALVVIDQDDAGQVALVTAAVLVETPPDVVWDLITDFEHQAEFMPQTEETTVARKEGNEVDVDYRLKFRFSVITKTVEFSNRHRMLPDEHRIQFWNISGDQKGAGEWQILPMENPTQTLLVYSSITELRSMGVMVRTLIKEQPSMDLAIQVSTASLVADAVKAHAEKRWAESKARAQK